MYARAWLILFFYLWTCAGYSQLFFENKAVDLGIINSGGSYNGVDPGGLSFFDYDNDGWDDITIGGKSSSQPIRFYKNNSGTFVEEFFNITLTGFVKQVIWVDYDGDGDNDFFAAVWDGSVKLFNNDGNFVFTDVTISAGFPNSSLKSHGASFGDYDNDGFLDVFISTLDYFMILPNYLYHNNGDGTFTNVSISAGIGIGSHYSFASAFLDFNNDGYQDIYVINDRVNTTNLLYRNNGNGTFTDISAASNSNVQIDAMSTGIEDFDYDGNLDIYITNTPSGNVFLKNSGNETFTNIATITGTVLNSTSWGANFADFDNDTDLDLYVSTSDPNVNGFFRNIAPNSYETPTNIGIDADVLHSYSNVIGDINNDGYVDILANNDVPENSSLWRNAGGTNNWLKVKLQGVQSNTHGVGSWIEVSVNGSIMNRYLLCGESFIGQNSAMEFFGIGTSSTIDYIKVKWLSGVEDVLYNVNPNQTLTIIENSNPLTNEEFDLQKIKIFPNPSSGFINIHGVRENLSVTIYDSFGRLIDSKYININSSKIDLNSYSKGIYFLEFKSAQNSITKKIILN